MLNIIWHNVCHLHAAKDKDSPTQIIVNATNSSTHHHHNATHPPPTEDDDDDVRYILHLYFIYWYTKILI